MVTTHTLKCLAELFDAVASGEKCFEVRRNDRGFEIGDELRLVRTDAAGLPTQPRQEIVKRVSYTLEGGNWGVAEDYVVLGLGRTASIDDYDDDAIAQAYSERFGRPEMAIERIYDLLVSGEISLAIEEMASAFDHLPAPDHARRVAACVARGRQKEMCL